MEYQNKISRLRQAFLRIQGQDLKQVLLRAAAKRAEGIAKNVFTTEEIFHAISEKIYKETNELSWNESFELVSDAESLSILKKELIEDVVQEFEWEETLFVLLEGLDEDVIPLVKQVLINQYNYNRSNESSLTTEGFRNLMIPIVRRIFSDFPARHLVGVQPLTCPVGLTYTLRFTVADEPAAAADEAVDDNDDAPPPSPLGKPGRKMTLEVIGGAVEAASRKLQAGWAIEAMQDLNSMHGLDIESEMIQALAAEISQEINFEIITNLKALGSEEEVVKLTGSQDNKDLQLSVTINRHCNEIARKTRRGAGNFIVVSSVLATAISKSKNLNFDSKTSHRSGYMSDLMEVGTLNGTVRVFSTLGMPDDEILVGYKGKHGEIDTGYVYCPYIPLMSSGIVVNAKTFQPVVALTTRYGKFTTDNVEDYYSNIKIEGMFDKKESSDNDS